jgi:hypothetical protein
MRLNRQEECWLPLYSPSKNRNATALLCNCRHCITNQVIVICPVVNGTQEGIILNAREAYTNSDGTGGTGGTGGALATAIYEDLKEHVDLKDERLLQAQGRVLDGQYLNEPFIAGMNEPIMQLFENSQIDLGSFD